MDATFSCVPKPFYQCFILMVKDKSLSSYIPVAYILMTGKTQECYYQALHVFKCDTDHECDPYSVGVDYEVAFFKMVNVQFPDAFLVGCFFHFMQALLKKLKELHVPKEQIAIAIRPDMLGLLPYLPKDELFAKGIPFVRTQIADEAGGDLEKMDAFFEYFNR